MSSGVGLSPLSGFRGPMVAGVGPTCNSAPMLSGPDGVARSGGSLASVQSPTGDALGRALASVGSPPPHWHSGESPVSLCLAGWRGGMDGWRGGGCSCPPCGWP